MSIQMIKDIYLIECITNLHVGSGDSDFGLIDNRVQRDVITNYPTINASSLKGAFAVHFNEEKMDKDGKPIRNKMGETIFGRSNSQESISGQGKYKFFSGNLLAIPARSKDRPYYLVTCKEILDDYNDTLALFGKSKINVELKTVEEKEIEGYSSTKYIEYLDNIIVILPYEDFKSLVDELPVIARNHLENGESKNLWYEEIVPRKSLFYLGIDKGVEDKEIDETFENKIEYSKNNGNLIHIGGNVTVGYGGCRIIKLGDKDDK